MDLSELKTELTTDPEAIGYDGAGDDAGDAALLNEIQASIQLNRSAIPMNEIYGAVDWIADWNGLSDAFKAAFQQITSTDVLDVTSPRIRSAFSTIFAATDTLTRLQGLLTQDGSRAEELWGEGARVTPSDVADARRI